MDWSAFYWGPSDIFGSGKVMVFGDVIDKGLGIDRLEQPGAFQIGPHNLRDIGAGLGVGWGGRQEIGNGDGQRLGVALGHIHLQGGMGGRRRKRRQRGQQD